MAEINHFLRIRVTPDKVFNAINSVQGLKGWWLSNASGNFEKDAELDFHFGEFGTERMKITKLHENEELEWTGLKEGMWKNTKTSFQLEKDGENTTILKFRYFDIPEDLDSDTVANLNYNWGRFLFSLKTYCETGEGFPVGGKI